MLLQRYVNYFNIPFWDVVEELARSGGRDAYIDESFEMQYFESGTRLNTTEAVVHEYNLINTEDFSPDLQEVYNKVKVYGSKIEGIPLLATATSSTSLTDGDIKELKINDSNITTQAQAQERADAEKDYFGNPPTVGKITSLGLPTLAPGERLRISDPLNGLKPSEYTIQYFTHLFSNDEPFQTEITIQKERVNISKILKKRILFEDKITENVNPDELDYSMIFDFTSDIGTHTNTVISDGILKTNGASTGTWESDTTVIDSNLTKVKLQISGSNLQGRKIFISSDGGNAYKEFPYGDDEVSIPIGVDIKLKVALPSATTEITAVGFLYTRE